MSNKYLWIAIMAATASFVCGFLLANTLNRGELDSLRDESERARTASSAAESEKQELALSPDEIRQKIDEADRNAGNFQFQKSLGLALYRYGSMKQDTAIITDAIRILDRAHGLDVSDRDIIVGLGNAHFDSGYFGKKNDSFALARTFYEKALADGQDDVEIRTDIGLTYFLQEPPDLERAITEFQKSLKLNPKHEKTLQFLVQALHKQNRPDQAVAYLEQLRQVNPKNEAISGLSSMLMQAK